MSDRLPKNLRRREAVEKQHHVAEEWRPIPGFPYEVSNLGRVLSHHHAPARILQPYPGAIYLAVDLRAGAVRRRATVHTLVAEAFLGPRPEGLEIRHLDGNHHHNVVENLAYGTRSENLLDRVRHGTHNHAVKTHCPQGHAYDEANTYYLPNVGRRCRTCRRQWSRDFRHRRALRAAGISS